MTAEQLQPRMSDDEYTHTQNVVTAITQTVCNLDLDGFLDRLFEAAALGPQQDPAMWKMAEHKHRQMTEITAKLIELRDLVNEHAEDEQRQAEELERKVKDIEAKHEEGSHGAGQPFISGDPSIIIGGLDTEEDEDEDES